MLAFIPCSNKKIKDWAVPAWLMYLPSPSFQKVYADAKKRADAVFIISGKYGVLHPDTVIEPYDARIQDATPEFMENIRAQVAAIYAQHGNGHACLSYCGREYEKALSGVPFKSMLSGGMFERFNGLEKNPGPEQGSTLPIIKVVAWAFLNSGCHVDALQEYIRSEYPHPVTQKCQFNRIFKSGFFVNENDRVVYTGHPADKK